MNPVTPSELALWSAMAGAILLLSLVAAADLVASRSVSAARGLAFILLTGGLSILLSGLPEMLLPALRGRVLLPLKASFGPLSGALALTYLGVWVGAARDDRLIRWTVAGGSFALVLAAVVLAIIALLEDVWTSAQVIAAAAVVNALSVLCAAVVAARGVTLGDALARWMVVACLCLAGMVGGLYSKALQATGLGMAVLTVACTIGYFLIVIALTLQRNREQRKLKRLARSLADPASGVDMTLGSRLLPQVEDALWRSARVGRDCVVAAISIANLYQLGGVAGHGVDQQILVVLLARIRRIVGFRNVVGLYHPRCFVLVVSAVQDPRRSQLLAARLRRELREPVSVSAGQNLHVFKPSIGVGLIRIAGSCTDALGVINRAEQLALEATQLSAGVIGEDFIAASYGAATG
ncbi:GGDEF domain-containing protein [Polaromonas sp.]|uniref:GGDEF domain-containing protein n=1 Tax=Polaromonas sp. TaxID=1869339 RepID=UPI0024889BC9|nr:GGDEF domain-containing protein [Polaromonas sp.]MDI1341423.1 GGDEF domain-containing protein [Polaromonas sp.]